jgi:hypothetical protein
MNPNEDLLSLGVALGQAHTFGLVAGKCSAAQAEKLRRLREEKQYQQVEPVWRDFCPKYIGMSSSQADRIIAHLEEFGPQYFQLAQLTRISPETYRAIAPAIQDGALQVNGEAVELAPENARQVAAAVAELRREASQKQAPSEPTSQERVADVVRRFRELVDDLQALMDESRQLRYSVAEETAMMGSSLQQLAQKNRA